MGFYGWPLPQMCMESLAFTFLYLNLINPCIDKKSIDFGRYWVFLLQNKGIPTQPEAMETSNTGKSREVDSTSLASDVMDEGDNSNGTTQYRYGNGGSEIIYNL